jgi:hypothetical protein
VPARSELRIGLESAADEIRIFDPTQVPDLLHTPDYLEALRLTAAPDEAEAARQEWIKLRLERQDVVLGRTPPRRLVVILGAGVLARPVGGEGVMAGQISWLRHLNRRDCFDIRILPWEAGPYPAMHAGAFTILDSHDDEDPSVVYVETLTGARYLEKPGELSEYRQLFRRLYDTTTSIDASRL